LEHGRSSSLLGISALIVAPVRRGMGGSAICSITTAGTFLGPIISGILYDLTRSYAVAFAIFSAVSLGAVALMFLARQPHPFGFGHGLAATDTRDLQRNQTSPRVI
jgi:MFS family permease